MTEAQTKAMMKGFTDRIPLKRMGVPDDIAKVVLFLASSAADYMTGSLVVVDGGMFFLKEERPCHSFTSRQSTIKIYG